MPLEKRRTGPDTSHQGIASTLEARPQFGSTPGVKHVKAHRKKSFGYFFRFSKTFRKRGPYVVSFFSVFSIFVQFFVFSHISFPVFFSLFPDSSRFFFSFVLFRCVFPFFSYVSSWSWTTTVDIYFAPCCFCWICAQGISFYTCFNLFGSLHIRTVFVVFVRLPFLSSFCLRFSRLFRLVLTAFWVSSFFSSFFLLFSDFFPLDFLYFMVSPVVFSTILLSLDCFHPFLVFILQLPKAWSFLRLQKS